MLHYKFISIILFFIFSFIEYSFCQNARLFSIENGLSSNLVNRIYQDKNKYIWISTQNGMNKFDGIRFSQYYSNDKNLKSVINKGDNILFVIEDANQNLWIARNDGLARYNKETDEFDEINFYVDDFKIFPYITSIVEIDSTNLMIATSGYGIYSVNINHKIVTNRDRIGSKIGVDAMTISTMYKDSMNNIWIATNNKDLLRYNPKTKTSQKIKIDNTLHFSKISSICEASNNDIYFAAFGCGILKYSSVNQKISLVENTNQLSDIYISTILYRSTENSIYIGTDGRGVKLLNIETNKLIDFAANNQYVDFSKLKVHSLLEDQAGNLWIGMFQKGVLMIPQKTYAFDYYGYKSYLHNTIGSTCILSIMSDNNYTWIGTDGDGIYLIDDNGNRIKHFNHIQNSNFSPPKTVMCIFKDSDNKIWLGAYQGGICSIDSRSGICNYLNIFGENSRLKTITDIDEDKDGNLWLSTLGEGIFVYNKKKNTILKHYEISTAENSLHNNWINTLLIDSEALVWIGTHKGIGCLNLKNERFDNLNNKKNILEDKMIYSIIEAADNTIWIGTSKGLYSYNKKNATIKGYTTKDGLPNDIICGLEHDDNGNIWISTHRGLSKLCTKTFKFNNYYLDAGIQGYEFWYGSHYKAPNGRLFFGGTSGITVFFPHEIIDVQKKVNITLTKFYVKGKEINLNSNSGSKRIINTHINDAKTINLSYTDNSFTFEFSALEFLEQERILFRYKIDKIDSEWMTTSRGINQATYTNLSPGKYRFSVQAIDNDNLSEIKVITLNIMPPWYLSTWAIVLWICLTIAVQFLILRLINQRQQEKNLIKEKEIQNNISEAKLQFFTNISHEIRTPMTLIISPLRKLLSEKTTENNTFILMYNNANRILTIINQLLDVRKIDNGKMKLLIEKTPIVSFIRNIADLFMCQSQSQNINLSVKFESNGADNENDIEAFIDPNHFDKVIFNIIANAFKHVQSNGNIEIVIKTYDENNEKWLQISIIDDGSGISGNEIDKVFERYYQIENNSPNIGSGIGLNLSKLIVELHHGRIYVNNNIEKGCTFTINLPTDEKLFENQISKSKSVNMNTNDIYNYTTPEFNFDCLNKKIRVFVVDDEIELRNYIAQEISPYFEVKCFENGLKALFAINSEKPDLIISDIMMPEMNGLELCRKVKTNSLTNDIPIILLTAKTKEEDQIKGMTIGADAYINKPFYTELLIETINNILKNRALLKSKLNNQIMYDKHFESINFKSSNDQFLERVNKVINENISNPDLSVDVLALNVGVSRVHLYRKMKELTNQSVRDYIKDIRLKQAAKILKGKGFNVSEVAYKVGFNNATYFSTLFKEKYGVTPKEYGNES